MLSDVMLNEITVPTVPQKKFLSNPKKKDQLPFILLNKFASANITLKKADENANCFIMKTALAFAPTHMSVIVIGEDIDLLLFLIVICTIDNVYFLKPGKGKIAQKTFCPLIGIEKQSMPIFYSYMP
ncbi:hypothetical protein AVEN_15188-1 [Araneus ventricosus]|uniref:Uncharacterized protein n=1 Tax=Araneus ventricosus TaxID=182803 RepID=A0A4Y2QIK0_ARAVE|nr:hypothetical protein AVEN_15188-1 [Araneus ventricosus]